MLYRMHRDGKTQATYTHHEIIIVGKLVGSVGRVACFDEVRVIDKEDRRRARDLNTAYFNGPVSVDVMNAKGEVIGRFAIADARDLEGKKAAAYSHELIAN